MKYLILIYGNAEAWSHPMFLAEPSPETAGRRDELTAQLAALSAEMNASGELVDAGALADPATAVTVAVRDGVPAFTDGPFVESKEQLAGYFAIDCEDQARVRELAARFPDALLGRVEIRPLMDPAGLEM